MHVPFPKVEAIAPSPNTLRIFPYKTPHCYPLLTSLLQFGGKANQGLPDETTSTRTERLLGAPPFHPLLASGCGPRSGLGDPSGAGGRGRHLGRSRKALAGPREAAQHNGQPAQWAGGPSTKPDGSWGAQRRFLPPPPPKSTGMARRGLKIPMASPFPINYFSEIGGFIHLRDLSLEDDN